MSRSVTEESCKFNIDFEKVSSGIVIMPSKTRRKHTYNQQRYGENRDKILAERMEAYDTNSEYKKTASKIASKKAYDKNPEPKKLASKQAYDKNPEPKKRVSKIAAKKAYVKNPEPKKLVSKIAASL